ncbi:hypothetical protein BST61_g5460 [Cercospora zeina]
MAKTMHTQTRKAPVMTRSKQRAADIDAAMRVFAIPEVLEQILYFAAARQMPRGGRDGIQLLKFKPTPGSERESQGGVCLFQLQRVNKDFHGIFKGSTKLKRLIYLAPYLTKDLQSAATPRSMLPFHQPFSVLMGVLQTVMWKRNPSTLRPSAENYPTTAEAEAPRMTLQLENIRRF